MRSRTTRAFTLIELLMVIAIIGILASRLVGGIALLVVLLGWRKHNA